MKMYIVRHPDGERYMKSRRMKRGEWVKDIEQAKVYSKLSSARGNVTWYANLTDSCPEILEFDLVLNCIHDEVLRVKKSKEDKERKRLEQAAKRLEQVAKRHEREVREAEARLCDAQNKLYLLQQQQMYGKCMI
jgi:hypothetical protein